jgi:hypothetical protein
MPLSAHAGFVMFGLHGMHARYWDKHMELMPRCSAGEMSAQELEQLMVIVSNPRTFKASVSGKCMGISRSNSMKSSLHHHETAGWLAELRRVLAANELDIYWCIHAGT